MPAPPAPARSRGGALPRAVLRQHQAASGWTPRHWSVREGWPAVVTEMGRA